MGGNFLETITVILDHSENPTYVEKHCVFR